MANLLWMVSMEIKTAQISILKVDSIEKNPHNPRRLFDKEPLTELMESIKDLGILVPLDVYPMKGEKNKYVLLDGERRWRCAKTLNLNEVPAIILERPDDLQNILIMFHIHNLREPWQLMPTALKLKKIMEMIRSESESRLHAVTRLSISQIRRCKDLLSYPKIFQNLMLAPPSERYKSDFFIDLNRFRKACLSDDFSLWNSSNDEEVIDRIIEKYDQEIIKSVTEFRFLATQYKFAKKNENLPEFEKKFKVFLEKDSVPVSDVSIDSAAIIKTAQTIFRLSSQLRERIEELNFEDIGSEEKTIRALQDLSELISKKLEDSLLRKLKK
jgi:ParB family chromosome partitioning protein